LKTKSTVALSMLAGVAIGGMAIGGLQAQTQPKVYLVSESEVLNAAEVAAYTANIGAVQKAAGGHELGTRGRVVASVGEPPQRVGISEWDNMEKVQAYLKSAERKKVVDGNKAVKITRQYVVETSK